MTLSKKKERMINVGDVNGDLTVISIKKMPRGYNLVVSCKCGDTFTITKSLYLTGKVKRCKSCHRTWLHDRLHLVKERIGEKHGLLTVEKLDKDRMSRSSTRGSYWICRCECGNVISVSNSYLHKDVASCGCKKHGLQLKRGFRDPAEASWRSIYLTYRKSAKVRNLTFDLSIDELKLLCNDICYYCGDSPSNEYKLKSHLLSGERVKLSTILYNGIDRIDNDKGYEKDNVVTCCKQCNYAKLKMSLDDFRTWITKVYKNLKDKEI